MALRIGVYLPTVGPTANADALKRFATHAEALGYDSLWTGDHIVFPSRIDFTKYLYGEFPVDSDVTSPFYEAVGTIGFLAGLTKTIRFGVGILVLPMRNAVVLGKQVASIDNLSDGRVVLGVGTGWMAEEFDDLGLPRQVFDERGAVTDETIDVCRALWREGTSTFHGRYHNFDGVGAYPKPTRPEGVPIWVGGNSAPALRRISRRGDGWQALGLSAEQFRDKNAQIDRLLEAAGREATEVTRSTALGLILTAPGAPLPMQPGSGLLVGDASSVAAQLNAFVEAGAQEVMFNYPAKDTDELLRRLDDLRAVVERL